MTLQNTSSSVLFTTQTQHHASNESMSPGCIPIRFSEWDYLPWNNPDNVVSARAETYASQFRTNALMILFVIGTPANVINMVVFYKQKLQDRVNLLLFSLSLSDEMYLVVLILHFFDEFYFQFGGGDGKKVVLMFVTNHHVTGLSGVLAVSFILSTIIACERCCCVLWPLRYQTLMRTRTLALIVVCLYVVIPALYFIVSFKYFMGCVLDLDTGMESVVFLQSEFYLRHKDLVDYLDIVVFGVGVPSVMMVVVAMATVITMSKLRQASAWRAATTTTTTTTTTSKSSGASFADREVALTKMLVGISVMLIVCVSPVCLLRAANLFLPELNIGGRNHNIYMVCSYVGYIFAVFNASCNIFIYYKMGTRYRDTFWALFKRAGDETIINKSRK